MSTKAGVIQSRVDAKLKRSTAAIFSRLGLTTDEAVRLFLKQVEIRRGLPFDLRIPNKETLRAINEADQRKNLKEMSFAEFKKSVME